jgi:hypothetical protein
VKRLLPIAAALLAAACSKTPPPPIEGLSPTGAPAPAQVERKQVALATPEGPAPAGQSAPAAQPGARAPQPVSPLAGLGPTNVPSWDDARKAAEARISAANADAELSALRAEIDGRP